MLFEQGAAQQGDHHPYNNSLARRRFYVNEIRHGIAELHGDEAQHLKRVLRAEPGQRYEISDTRSAWLAEITEARKDRVVFRAIEPATSVDMPVRVDVVAAIIKFDRFEWMVEKATELGAQRIVPVDAVRTDKGLFDAARKRVERWRRIARESGQQSRRLAPPEVLDPLRLPVALQHEAGLRCFLDEAAGTTPLIRAVPHDPGPLPSAAVLIGPEGGWTDDERASALSAGWIATSLGPNILRAETAAIAAVSVIVNSYCR
jgi:16S rRNA (uracil1498-N3)-methyltransferase